MCLTVNTYSRLPASCQVLSEENADPSPSSLFQAAPKLLLMLGGWLEGARPGSRSKGRFGKRGVLFCFELDGFRICTDERLASGVWNAVVLLRELRERELREGKHYPDLQQELWRPGTVFGDPIIAAAILDRLLHHSTTVNIRGESYRLKDRRKAGLIPQPERREANPDCPRFKVGSSQPAKWGKWGWC